MFVVKGMKQWNKVWEGVLDAKEECLIEG